MLKSFASAIISLSSGLVCVMVGCIALFFSEYPDKISVSAFFVGKESEARSFFYGDFRRMLSRPGVKASEQRRLAARVRSESLRMHQKRLKTLDSKKLEIRCFFVFEPFLTPINFVL